MCSRRACGAVREGGSMTSVRALVLLLALAACAGPPPPAPPPPGYNVPHMGGAGMMPTNAAGLTVPPPGPLPVPQGAASGAPRGDSPAWPDYNEPHMGGAGMVPLDQYGITFRWPAGGP